MTQTLIVSDIHLDPTDPARYRITGDAIRKCAADTLVLAGDIFEAWVGDDGAESIDIEFLIGLKKVFPNIFFIPGNRDFLVSSDFLDRFGIAYATNIESTSFMIVHGDEFCTEDQDYQNFRQMVRSDWWQQKFLAKSLAERQLIAANLRDASKANQCDKSKSIADVEATAISSFFQSSHVPLLIHGHTHRPGFHFEHEKLRVVTSDWDATGVAALIDETDEFIKVSLLFLSHEEPKLIRSASYNTGIPEWNLNC